MIRRRTLVIAMHDGFFGSGTGAGLANHAFLRTLIGLLDPGVRLMVMPVRLAEASPQYQADWHQRTAELCQSAGATVLPVDNGTGGLIRFGDVAEFHCLAASTAAVLAERVLPWADPSAIVCFDIPFLGLPSLLPDDVRPHVTIVPHSTALLHDPGNAGRLAFERGGLDTLIHMGGRVAVISDYMRDHLVQDYGVPAKALLALADGLAPDEWGSLPACSSNLPPRAESGFLLALGRASPYKG